MKNKNVRLIDKLNNPVHNGYLSDDEVLLLLEKCKSGIELANELDAGNAVNNYYFTLSMNIQGIARARNLNF